MKKVLRLLITAAFAVCLLGFAFEHAPAAALSATIETELVACGSAPVEKETVPLAPPVQVATWVVTALVFVLFSLLVVSPLVIDHPALAAECLARPLLAERLIQEHFAGDDGRRPRP